MEVSSKALSKVKKNKENLIAFGWYGGKYSQLNWLLPLLPSCHHYCEPFGGSAAVLLNRDPSPLETYDIDGEVVNFFKVLKERPDELIRLIVLTPFSRQEYELACQTDASAEPIERARRFYVRARQVRTGLAQAATPGRWAYCKDTSRSGMAGNVSRWLGGIESLPKIAARLRRVRITNRPAVEIIRLCDSPLTLFYCDPPYVHETRGDTHVYAHEMSDEEHRELAATLNAVQGLVAISGYDCELMSELYPPPKWHKIVTEAKTIHSTKDKRVEVLWTNYDPHTVQMANANFHQLCLGIA